MLPIFVALLLSSNGSGKTLVRTQSGTLVPVTCRITTNYMKGSGSSCTSGNVVESPWGATGSPTCVNNAAPDPWGGSGMDTWTSAVSTDRIFQAATTPSADAFTGSVFVAKASGTGTATVIVRCGAVSAVTCTCETSDGSACTSTIATADCQVRATAVGTTTIRLSAHVACVSAITNPTMYLNPGDYGNATGTSRFVGMQLHASFGSRVYIPTTAAATATACR